MEMKVTASDFFSEELCERASAAAQLLCAAKRVLILCHIRPDGDTLGSAFALKEALSQRGIETDVWAGGPVEDRYGFLGETKEPTGEYDLVVAVDAASKHMIEYAGPYADRVDLLIDHHRTGGGFARRLEVIEPSAAACAEVVYIIAEKMGAQLTRPLCAALYTALATDTGCFRYSNTEQFTHAVAAKLLSTGFKGTNIIKELFETKSPEQIKLEYSLFNAAEFVCGGAVAIGALTDEIIELTGAGRDEFEGLSGFLRSIRGVEAAALLKQAEDGRFRVSMRSNKLIDVSAVCAAFGGGGHARAAGCFMEGPLEAAKAKAMEVLKDAYEKTKKQKR